jgi:hypothetical protein
MVHFPCWSGFEQAEDPPNALILGFLKDVDEVQLPIACVVYGRGVEEGWDNHRAEDHTALFCCHSLRAVGQHAQSVGLSNCLIGHPGCVSRPVERWSEPYPEVSPDL